MWDLRHPTRCCKGLRLQRCHVSIRPEIGPKPKMIVVPGKGLLPCRPAVLTVTVQGTQKIDSYFKCLKILHPLSIMILPLYTSLVLPQHDCDLYDPCCSTLAWLRSLWLLLLYPSLTAITVNLVALLQHDSAHCDSCYSTLAWLRSLWLLLL
jgi:hypothetical protein